MRARQTIYNNPDEFREGSEDMARGVNGSEPRWRSPEFWLIIMMLVFMTVILIAVMFLPFPLQGDSTGVTAETIMGFRRDVFTAVVTAFAAWIGAGAAYFFGRENMREAITAIKGVTPREILEQKRLSEVMRPLEPTVTEKDTIETVQERVLKDPGKWFVTILDEQGRLSNVIHEEAIQRYLADNMKTKDKAAKEVYVDLMETPIKDVVEYIEGKSKDIAKLAKLIYIHVPMSTEQNCAGALERMDREEKYLTFIVDSKGIPKGYLTTGDLRKELFQT